MNLIQQSASLDHPRALLIDAIRLQTDRVPGLQRYLVSGLGTPRPSVIIWCASDHQARLIAAGLENAGNIAIRVTATTNLPSEMRTEAENCVRRGLTPMSVYSFDGRILREFNVASMSSPQYFARISSLGEVARPERTVLTPSVFGSTNRPLPSVFESVPLSDADLRTYAETLVRALALRQAQGRGPSMFKTELKVLMEAIDPRVPRGKSQSNGHPYFMTRVVNWALSHGWVRENLLGVANSNNPHIELLFSHPEVAALARNLQPLLNTEATGALVNSAAQRLSAHEGAVEGRKASDQRTGKSKREGVQGCVRSLKAASQGPYHGALHRVLDAVEPLASATESSTPATLVAQAVETHWRSDWYKYGDPAQLTAAIVDVLRRTRVIENGKKDLDIGWRNEVERRMVLTALEPSRIPWPGGRYDLATALYFDETWNKDRQARGRAAARVMQHVIHLLAHGQVEEVQEVGEDGITRTFLQLKQLRLTGE